MKHAIAIALLLAPVVVHGAGFETDLGRGIGMVSVVNGFGGVEIAYSNQTTIDVKGAEIDAIEDGSVLVLTVIDPGSEARSDIEVVLPDGVAAMVSTDRHEIHCTAKPSHPLSLRSTTGAITFITDADVDVTIDLATSGEITTDFSIEIAHAWNREPSKKGGIVLGAGSVPVTLESLRGSISVLAGNSL